VIPLAQIGSTLEQRLVAPKCRSEDVEKRECGAVCLPLSTGCRGCANQRVYSIAGVLEGGLLPYHALASSAYVPCNFLAASLCKLPVTCGLTIYFSLASRGKDIQLTELFYNDLDDHIASHANVRG
jgi:hypothetical protein